MIFGVGDGDGVATWKSQDIPLFLSVHIRILEELPLMMLMIYRLSFWHDRLVSGKLRLLRQFRLSRPVWSRTIPIRSKNVFISQIWQVLHLLRVRYFKKVPGIVGL